ncbi:HAD domain-containing protein [Candidatus Parabeggiatoa sp. HSG14]|uniref:HAD domain-containing protein n=1 Tax=Candidatus Parabeggiatoa sp. HSG14 TaxID=3055593 RepID=UPI0025A80426|nr:HAD domain-containing protein [Thiotrichales bacterium HSG14]
MYVFLDFDGVLRRLTSEPSRFESDCLKNFESAIRPLPNVKIVISSTWRLAMSLNELRRLFSTEIAEKIVGVTPTLSKHVTHERYKEIQAYLKKRNIENEGWVAIDDDPEHYPKGLSVLFTDPNEGFDVECVTQFWKHVVKEIQ